MLKLKQEELHTPPDRQRQEFDPEALQKLATSIDQFGLFNALRVRPRDQGGYWLVQGERRLRAIRDYLWPTGSALRYAREYYDEGVFPCVDFGALDPLAAEEFELSENIDRADLTWQERASASSRISNLRQRIAERDGLPGPSIADIANEVRGGASSKPIPSHGGGKPVEDTRREIIVARYLDDPEIKSAKSLDDAFKALKRREEADRHAQLAAKVGPSFTAESHTAVCADSVTWMAKADAEQFDVILTDPPYGIDAQEFGDSGGKAAGPHRYDDSPEAWGRLASSLASQSYRLAKPQAHAYVFCDIDNFFRLRELFEFAGWWVHRTPIIWHKPAAARVPWPEHGPQRKWELVLYAVKGKRPVTRIFPDLVSYQPDENLGHQAQKPIALFVDLLKRSVSPGDKVLDPFCGSGPIFPAAHELKCRATGIELDPSAYGIALKRLSQLKAAQELGL